MAAREASERIDAVSRVTALNLDSPRRTGANAASVFVAAAVCMVLARVVAADAQRGGRIVAPLGLDLYIPAPADNPITAEKIEAGRRLFFDRRLSGDGRTSCATCHQPARAFADGRRMSQGAHRRAGRRNTPSLLNRAYGTTFSWDGRASSLEEQVRFAFDSETDLALPLTRVADRVRADATYQQLFRAAFDRAIDEELVTRAIATFVRSRLSGGSAFDRFLTGERGALNQLAQRGRALFVGAARCGRCHSGALLSDEAFHNTGVSWPVDPGRFGATGRPDDRGRFKTPSLRNVAMSAPYMHDGTIPTLDAVVAFYNRGGGANPNLSSELRPLNLSALDRRALVAFLRALTSSP